MEKVSSYISKKVISIEEGNIIGYILDIVFDESFTKCQAFIVVDDESENTFSLNKNDIMAVGEDCVLIKNAKVLEINVINQSLNPIGKPVYDKNGLLLGYIIDIILSSFNIKKIITTKCEIPLKFISKIGRDCVLYGTKTRKRLKTNFTIKTNKIPMVYIQSENDNVIKFNSENKAQKFDAVVPTKPIRLFANTNSLIGKEIKTDIYGYNHEIIIRKYDKITQANINKAKLHNKLNLLFIYSE